MRLPFNTYKAAGLDSTNFYFIHNGFTQEIEAGWTNDRKDKGGETIFGISRVANPTWGVWDEIDKDAARLGRGTKVFIAHVNNDKDYFLSAAHLLYTKYFLPIKGDSVPQNVAAVLYDLSVHAGPTRSVIIMQRAINALKWNPPIDDDGEFGKDTMAALQNAIAKDEENLIKQDLRLRLKWHLKANPEYTNAFRGRVEGLWNFIFGTEMPRK